MRYLRFREINILRSAVTVELARDQNCENKADDHAVKMRKLCELNHWRAFICDQNDDKRTTERNFTEDTSDVLRLACEPSPKGHKSVSFCEACRNGLLRLIYFQ